jgi:O-methyltransferase
MSWISVHVPCAHTEEEMLEVLSALFSLPPDRAGAVVEAGCFKGGSAAKLSLGARLSNRPVHLFDSFVGIPENLEREEGGRLAWPTGSWAGSEMEVRRNIACYGEISSCSLHRGWFEETLKDFHEPIAVAFLDVDLAASTRTCLKYLYPQIIEGGTLFSQDGHMPLVRAVLADTRFWEQVVGCRMPTVEGLGTRKLLRIVKTAAGP